MGIKFHDRVKDTSTTTGTGNITVSGTAPNGYQTFSARLSVGDRFYYVIAGQTGTEWETGYATYTGTNAFSRDKVEQSSNADALVNFSAGTKDVFLTAIADRFIEMQTKGVILANARCSYVF